MKKIVYLLAFLLVSLTSVGQVVNFSGTWALNKAKSTLNDQFSMAPGKMILVQNANDFAAEKHVTFQDQEFTTNDKFTLDGNECVNVGWMDSKKKSVCKWSEDSKSLTITSKLPIQDSGEMTIVEIYKIEGDNLKVEVTASSSYGDMAETYLFDKQ